MLPSADGMDQHLVAERGVEFAVARRDGADIANFVLCAGRADFSARARVRSPVSRAYTRHGPPNMGL
jgi:hypothetical protein